jgi:hypothetical protein
MLWLRMYIHFCLKFNFHVKVPDLPRIFWTAHEKASWSNDILVPEPGDEVPSSAEFLTSVAKVTPFPLPFFIPLFGRTGGVSVALDVSCSLVNERNWVRMMAFFSHMREPGMYECAYFHIQTETLPHILIYITWTLIQILFGEALDLNTK